MQRAWQLYHRAREVVRNFSELVMFQHTIFSASFLVIAMCVASIEVNGSLWMGWHIVLLCGVALISARNFAMSCNRLCDRDIDARNIRTQHRPSVDGRLCARWILIFCVINACVFVITSAFINDLALILSAPFLAILGGYSMMKRYSSLAHVVLGVALGLAPLAGVIAVSGNIPLWSVLLACGVVCWVAGFDVLYSLQDMQIDRQEGLFSIPARFGEMRALAISRAFHMLTIMLWGGFIYIGGLGAVAWLGLMLSAFMLGYEQWLVARSLANIPKAFFITNGYLGFLFLICIIIDGAVRISYAQ